MNKKTIYTILSIIGVFVITLFVLNVRIFSGFRVVSSNPSNNSVTPTESGLVLTFSEDVALDIAQNKNAHITFVPQIQYDVIVAGKKVMILPFRSFEVRRYSMTLRGIRSVSGESIDKFLIQFEAKVIEAKSRTKKQNEAAVVFNSDVEDILVSRFPEVKKIEKYDKEFNVSAQLSGRGETKKDLLIIISLKPEVLYSYDEELALAAYDRVYKKATTYLSTLNIKLSDYTVRISPSNLQSRYIK